MTKVPKLAYIGIALWTIAAHAQQTTGTITGTVTDTSDAAMAQAAVRLIDSGTGVQRNTTTADNGDFAFRLLAPGIYSVDVSIPGFKSFQQTGIIVEADRSLALPIRLELGAVSERVTIEAVTPLLEPNTSSLGTVMEQRKIESLPLNGRNPMGLANLVPTVRGIGYFGGQELSTWRASAVSIGGGQPLAQGYMLDGIANDKLGDSGTLGLLTVDATQEFKVLTNSMSAEFGRTAGGVISVISRSGTNAFHGSLFEYFRNSQLNANEFFANRANRPRPTLKFNQFGGTLGGPIRREKLFFFVNYEKYMERREAQRIITSPTVEQRAGDFSNTRAANGELIRIYDPLTVTPGATPGTFVRQPSQETSFHPIASTRSRQPSWATFLCRICRAFRLPARKTGSSNRPFRSTGRRLQPSSITTSRRRDGSRGGTPGEVSTGASRISSITSRIPTAVTS